MSNQLTKPGAKPGNTNAQRGEEQATSNIVFRCTPVKKATLVRAAQARGMKLTAFILDKLNL